MTRVTRAPSLSKIRTRRSRATVVEYAQLSRRGQITRLRQLAAHALPLFAIEPTSLSLLGHGYHTTFRVTDTQDRQYVLHILRPMEDVSSEREGRTRVRSELWWLDHLKRQLHLPVPAAVRTPEGEGVVSVSVDGVTPPRLCTLFHWIDGRLMLRRLTPKHLHAVGHVTAHLHADSAALAVPSWFDRPHVDRADVELEAEITPLFTNCLSADAAEVIRRVLERVRQVQHELGNNADEFGLIHADIHQKNYLFTHGDVRIIDFGDCGWGHYIYDLAVTVHQLGAGSNRGELRAALLTGYRRVRDLSRTHEALLDTFALLREVQDLTWFLQARDDPTYTGRLNVVEHKVAILERELAMHT